VHAFINELERPVGTHLYGRRLYETMVAWEHPDAFAHEPVTQDFAAIWQAADKIVYSTTLDAVTSARTRLEPNFDLEAVRRLKASSDRDFSIGGPTLAAHAIAGGLVDELHLFLTPVLVGGGTPSLPTGVRAQLELVDEHRFSSGVVHLHYRFAQ
jgi:dihydrofolate reductase